MYDMFSVTPQLLHIYVMYQGLGSFVFVQGYCWSLICLQSTLYHHQRLYTESRFHILSRFYVYILV